MLKGSKTPSLAIYFYLNRFLGILTPAMKHWLPHPWPCQRPCPYNRIHGCYITVPGLCLISPSGKSIFCWLTEIFRDEVQLDDGVHMSKESNNILPTYIFNLLGPSLRSPRKTGSSDLPDPNTQGYSVDDKYIEAI